VFYHNEEQKKLALDTKKKAEERLGSTVYTEIEPYREFYLAEDYHQKYSLRQHDSIIQELRAIYPETRDFINSTAVARLNGYLGGNGTPEGFTMDIHNLGLSDKGKENLRTILSETRPAFRSCPIK
jgi:hypothetical protein